VKLLQILTNSSAVSCLQVQSCIVNITFWKKKFLDTQFVMKADCTKM
jgi:hypothetical protein